MKTLLAVTVLCLLCAACASLVSGSGTEELHVRLEVTTGEHSKDSSSETTIITVEQSGLNWERTYSGREKKTPRLQKKVALSAADRVNLRKSIRANNLLLTNSITLPQVGANYGYFEILLDITLGTETGKIKISGPRTAVQVKDERLYQNTLALIKELYQIINSQDPEVRFEELILYSARR